MTSLLGADTGLLSPLAERLQAIIEDLAATATQPEIVLTSAVQALGAVAATVLLVDPARRELKVVGSQGYEDGVRTVWQEGLI